MTAYVIVPASVGFQRGCALASFAGYELHTVADNGRATFALQEVPPADLRFGGPTPQQAYVDLSPIIVLPRKVYGREDVLSRRDRRRMARRGKRGRRSADPVPVGRRWRVYAYHRDDVPPYVVRDMLDAQPLPAPEAVAWYRYPRSQLPRWS